MRFRLPRLRRRGGTMPAYPGGPDSVMVAVSPGAYFDPHRHYFDLGTNIGDTNDWLTMHGYTWQPATDDINDGLRITSPGKPDVIAPMGSVLVWDGEQISVEEISA